MPKIPPPREATKADMRVARARGAYVSPNRLRSGPEVVPYTAVSGNAVNVETPYQSLVLTGDVTLTYSDLTPVANTRFRLKATADDTKRTITLPAAHWDLNRNGEVSTIVVPANATLWLLFEYNGTRWEVFGPSGAPACETCRITFDPKAVCDGAVDRLFLMKVGAEAPNGINILAWRLSFEADPTTELDANAKLKRASSVIGVTGAADMDVIQTTNGVASESTAANINGGATVANGQVIYLEFGTAYTEANHQIIFEMEYSIA